MRKELEVKVRIERLDEAMFVVFAEAFEIKRRLRTRRVGDDWIKYAERHLYGLAQFTLIERDNVWRAGGDYRADATTRFREYLTREHYGQLPHIRVLTDEASDL